MPTRLQRIARYLGLSDYPAPVQAGALLDGIAVTSLEDVYRVMTEGTATAHVTRGDADRVPAVVSVRNKINATLAGMPLVQRRKDGLIVTNAWLEQPNPSRPRAVELKDTVLDLFYDGVAYWRVLSRGAGANGPGTGFPTATQWVSQSRVRIDPSDGGFYLDGKRVAAGELIQFEGMHAGILHEGGATAILDANRIARAAAMFTNSPFPLGYFTDREPDLEADRAEVDKFLPEWSSLRRRNAWGYVPGSIKLETVDIDPAKLQLSEARRQTSADIALAGASNLEDVGVSTTSRVYFNATQIRKDQLDYQMMLYTAPLAQRLSMRDCTPTGHTVEFSTDNFLSVDEKTRNEIYALGLKTGVYADINEVRAAAGKPPLTPEQIESRKAEAGTQSALRDPAAGRRGSDAPPPEAPKSSGGSQPPASKEKAK